MVERSKVHAKVEPGGLEEPEECRQSGLPATALIGGNHRGRNASAFRKLSLAKAGLQPGELQ